MKRVKNKLRERKGMTMVNVLVAFALLAFILLMFQRSVTLSSKIYRLSEETRRNTEALLSAFYSGTFYDPHGPGGTTYTFSDSMGGSFTLDSSEGSFQPEGSPYRVYYFGGRTGAGG